MELLVNQRIEYQIYKFLLVEILLIKKYNMDF